MAGLNVGHVCEVNAPSPQSALASFSSWSSLHFQRQTLVLLKSRNSRVRVARYASSTLPKASFQCADVAARTEPWYLPVQGPPAFDVYPPCEAPLNPWVSVCIPAVAFTQGTNNILSLSRDSMCYQARAAADEGDCPNECSQKPPRPCASPDMDSVEQKRSCVLVG
jgi:hypothetical protein